MSLYVSNTPSPIIYGSNQNANNLQSLLTSANLVNGYTTTVSSASPIVLTYQSNGQQFITGSTAQTFTLPVTTTIPANGQSYLIVNNSSATATVNSNGGSLVISVPANTSCLVTCINVSSDAAASWAYQLVPFSNASILAVANGGTGTSTAFTAGSVVFAGTNGVYAQKNANLFWDNTNNRLSVGTATAVSTVTVAKSVVTAINLANNYLQLGGTENQANSYRLIGFGYNSASTNMPAYMGYQEIHNNGQTSGDLIFGTRSVQTDTAPAEKMRISETGIVSIGVAGTTQGQLNINGATSGTISVKAQAAAGTYNLNLPITAGTTGQFLTSQGGSSTAMTWTSYTAPTVQRFTSGSAQTYTTPTNPSPLYIRVKMVGGGGGGGAGASGGTNGTAGGNTTFGTSLLVANGGGFGNGGSSSTGGAGGTASLAAPAIGSAFSGSDGEAAEQLITSSGGGGGASVFGGAGRGGVANSGTGTAGATNSGSGGGGGGASASVASGGGGGAGGYVDVIIPAPSATYTYTVGASGSGGTGGNVGGAGAAGVIVVEEFYQ